MSLLREKMARPPDDKPGTLQRALLKTHKSSAARINDAAAVMAKNKPLILVLLLGNAPLATVCFNNKHGTFINLLLRGAINARSLFVYGTCVSLFFDSDYVIIDDELL